MNKIDKSLIEEIVKEQLEAKESVEAESKSKETVEESKVEVNVPADEIMQEVAKNIVDAIKGQLGGDSEDAKYLKGQLYSREEGLKAVKYPSMKELNNLDDNEKIAVYFKALFSKNKTAEDNAILKGLSEGTAGDGGNLVPVPLRAEIIRLMGDRSVMRGLATILPMTSQTLEIPTLANNGYANWIPERVVKTTTSAEFGKVTLTAQKLVARILISEELNDDSIVALVPWITQQFAEYIATAEDRAFFTGTGVNQPRGISIEAITQRATGGVLDFDEVNYLYRLVRQSVRNSPKAAFIAHGSVIAKLERIKDTDGGYIWRRGLGRTAGQTEVLPDTIWGRPIYEQNDLSQSELYFGDWSKYYIGDRKKLYIRQTDTTETSWTEDAIDIKAVERVDGRAGLLGAFAKLTGI